MSGRVLVTDVYVHPPEGGTALRLPRGTKEGEVPDWVRDGKARNVRGEETDMPLLGPENFVDADDLDADPTDYSPGPGDDGFVFGFREDFFKTEDTDETEVNVPAKEPEPTSKPRARR